MNRGTFIEQIRRAYYNGMPSKDADLTPNEVNLYVNQAMGFLALKNYTDSIKIDGIENVGDAFYTTFKATVVAADADTGYYSVTLPQAPVGLGRGYGISTVTFPVSTGLAKAPIPISPRELDYYTQLPIPPSKVFYWSEGNKLKFQSYINLTGKKAIVRMISTSSSDLTEELNLPEEYLGDLLSIVLDKLKFRKSMPQDLSADGIDKA